MALSMRRCLVSVLLAVVMLSAWYRCMLLESVPKNAAACSSAASAAAKSVGLSRPGQSSQFCPIPAGLAAAR